MNKRTLVSEKLICDVIILLSYIECDLDYGESDEVKHLCVRIQTEISEKLERKKLHDAFTAYKMAAPSQDRESLRKNYIELAQIRKSFTCNHEIPYHLLK
jgi:hypothetical protein